MKTVSILVGFVAACLSGISTASASTLFSDLGQTEVGFAFLPDTNRVLASDFLTGPSPTVVTGATLKLANPDFLQHTFTASIWSDNAGVPGALLGTFDSIVLASGSSGDFATTSPGINLAASTAYWQVVQVNENSGGTNPPQWKFTTSSATDLGSSFATISSTTPKGSMTGGATWFDFNPGNFQFAIVGVPEPSTWFLAAIGLASLFVFSRRPG